MLCLRDDHWDRILEHVPEEHIPDSRPGCKPIPTRAVLEAVLWILNTGAQWHLLPQCYPIYTTVHRRLQQWCKTRSSARFSPSWRIRCAKRGAIDEHKSCIDATFAAAKGGGDAVGLTKRWNGLKILAFVDRHGLPLSVSTHAAHHHEVTLVQLSFDFYLLGTKPDHLIGDCANDSDPLDAELRHDGVNMIAPHRSNRKLKTQDGAICVATSAAGWTNGSLPGSNGSDGCWFAGSITPPTSWDLCSSPASRCYSNNFEIGSSGNRGTAMLSHPIA